KEVRLSEEAWIKQVFLQCIQNSFQKGSAPATSETIPTFSAFSFTEKDFTFAPQLSQKDLSPQYEIRATSQIDKREDLPIFEKLQIIGIWNNFLMAEVDALRQRGLISGPPEDEPSCAFIDLKAVKSRCIFDRIVKENPGHCHMQGLLFPMTIDLSVHEAQVLMQMEDILSRAGFNIAQSGPKSFLIDAIPAFLKEEEAKEVIYHMVRETISLDNDTSESLEVKKKRRLAEFVCRFVKTRKENILLQEAVKLIDELAKTTSPSFCPQGNKTIVILSAKHVSSYFTGEKIRNTK
ncbi:MAG: hypothetical protein FJZ57_07565, partial [Chlamydiae bacterium]|nr:hypothetical protein [Chlamydiota bacterium]